MMDCNRFHELMWEDTVPDEALKHFEECPECKKEYELVKKMRSSLASSENMTGRIMARIVKEKRRQLFKNVTKIAAAFVVLVAVGFFARIAINSGFVAKESVNDNGAFDREEIGLVTKSESTTANDQDYSSDGSSNDMFDYNYPMEAEPEEDFVAMEPESPKPEPETASGTTVKEEVLESEEAPAHDLYMLLNEYKYNHGISQHTADIIVSGGSLDEVLDTLYELGAVIVDSHVEINGDFYFEAQMLLEKAGFTVALTSSSETIKKTLVYFEDLLI
ncbi:MAG: hypothetical protein IKV53_06835 [Clostridia bacterium]|nr:hypothetical protein [Clostridia bacterium]